VLLYPEGVLLLNAPAAAVLELCDGRRTLADLLAVLGRRYRARPEELTRDVAEFLSSLRARGLLH
jgi:pyrroloquinoline quinone biosynthesis protein D